MVSRADYPLSYRNHPSEKGGVAAPIIVDHNRRA
jgi:hypothetical protein